MRQTDAVISYEHDTDRAIAAATGEWSAVLVRAVDPMTLRAVARLARAHEPGSSRTCAARRITRLASDRREVLRQANLDRVALR